MVVFSDIYLAETDADCQLQALREMRMTLSQSDPQIDMNEIIACSNILKVLTRVFLADQKAQHAEGLWIAINLSIGDEDAVR